MYLFLIFVFVFDKKYLFNKLIVFLILAIALTSFVTFNKEYNKRFWGQFVKPLIFGKTENMHIIPKKQNFFELEI